MSMGMPMGVMVVASFLRMEDLHDVEVAAQSKD
jgi:hypothetical protein